MSLSINKMHQNLCTKGRGQGVFVHGKHGNFIGWLLSTLFSLDMTVDLCFRKKN